ncbi:HMG1 [Symbiodinium natans]|uniref:HMG1 protein n=1 Tax=Symbiodinium natans TaxID=878477 RepID=A0A812JPF9_9DINO|nr:HMG1 [Symbiodinium natans]
MTTESGVSRRDLLVQQLLEERRQRLQHKLYGSDAPKFQDYATVLSQEYKENDLSDLRLQEASPKYTDAVDTEIRDGLLADVLARLPAESAPSFENPKSASPDLERTARGAERARQHRPQSAPQARPKKDERGEVGRVGSHSTERRRRSNGERPQPFERRLHSWQMQHKAAKMKHVQARQEKELQEMDECTFQPSINTRSEYYARRSRSCLAEPLPERLFHEADKRANLRNKAKELMEADALCSYTFQPNINPRSKGTHTVPLYLRADELRQRREQRVRSAQLAEERRSENLFQPKISNRSERIVQKKRDVLYRCASQGQVDCLRQLGPVEERLYAEAQEKEKRRAALQDFHQESLQSFPSVDDTSRRICKGSVYFQGPQQDFLTRQQTFELAKQKRLEVRTRHAESDCCFQPTTGNHLDLGETPEERIHRLAVQDVERREQTRVELEQLHRKDCTFKPQINAVSEMLASSRNEASTFSSGRPEESGPHERLYRSAMSKHRAGEDEWLSDECSFRPQLDPRSSKRFSHIKSRYANRSDLLESIRQEQEKKAEYLLERRRELEEEKAANCTFAPRVKEVFQDSQKPIAVSGLDRFFELKSLALKKQQEKLEREQRVFRPESVAVHEGVTVPEPFQLSEGPSKEFRRPPLDEDCTFTPQTNETHNREMIRQIMGAVKVH